MRPTKEWVERLEASGVTWGLFVSIPTSAFTNYVLSNKETIRYGRNNVSPYAGAARSLWTIREPIIADDGSVILTHYEHRQPRPGMKTYVFAREFPDITKYSCPATHFISHPNTWKRFRDILETINPQGITVGQLLLAEHGNTKHEFNIGFENENDAILFKTLTEKRLTNTA